MRILFIAHRAPFPPHGGAKVRPFEMIRHLAKSHELSVATLARDQSEWDEFQGIAPYCTRFHASRVYRLVQALKMVAALATRIPSSVAYFHSRELHATVRQWHRTSPFDLIVCFSSSMGRYALGLGATVKIIDFCDLDSQKWFTYAATTTWPKRWGYRLEGFKMQAEEVRLGSGVNAITVATKRELADLSRLAIACHSDWFSNGVDMGYFAHANGPAKSTSYDPDTLCFLGRMDYFPNEDAVLYFTQHVLPLIRRVRPMARLLIIGAAPTDQVRALSQVAGVEVTGTVADVRPFAYSACAMVAPLRIARGMQNKILEAMAMGIPTVTSTLAASGVDAVVGEHLFASDDAAQFAAHCLQLMTDPTARQRIADQALRRVQSHHSWAHCLDRFDALVGRCMQDT